MIREKQYLYTWYGVSDLMAALGDERQPGPILNALLHEDYQHVYILAYTNAEKDRLLHGEDLSEEQLLLQRDHLTPRERTELAQRIGNTDLAHRYFTNWVCKILAEAGKETQVHLDPVELAHLNDTEQIYAHVMKGFRAISARDEAKRVTLFLSPGTPVMAFIWAFSALRQPQLNLRLISSSNANQPPETIHLPAVCLSPHDCHINEMSNDKGQKCDVVFHLFGEQRWPILQCMNHFYGAQHVFVYNEKYTPESMGVFLGSNVELKTLQIDHPFNYAKTFDQLNDYMTHHIKGDERVVFNMTGGTKPMFIAAYQLCRERNYLPVYVNGDDKELINLNDNSSEMIKPIPRVSFFLQLNHPDMFISNQGITDLSIYPQADGRIALARLLWKHRAHYRKCLRDDGYGEAMVQFEADNAEDKDRDLLPCLFATDPHSKLPFSISVERTLSRTVVIDISINGQKSEHHQYKFDAFPNLVPFLRGIWLEEYTFNELKILQEERIIFDLRMGLELTLRENKGDKLAASQEFDILFTDGNALYVVECKSGAIKAEHFAKLVDNARKYGGIKAKPIYVSASPIRTAEAKGRVLLEKLTSTSIIWNYQPCYKLEAGKHSYRLSSVDRSQYEGNLFELLRTRLREEAT